MDLTRFEQLISKLPVRDKYTNATVPFIFNPNQAKALQAIRKQYENEHYIRLICCKSRRVGMSSMIDALLFAHCLARPQAHAEIIAQLKDTSEKGLFRVPRDLANALNKKTEVCQVFKRNISFTHSDGDSLLDIATAGTVVGGRGLTLTALHLSEAGLYPGSGSFLSVLPAVGKGDDTIIAVESSPYGRTGIGQAFFEFWGRANQSGRNWNGYIPIFLSWLDDPECVRDPEEADDAPATDLERELMAKPWHATRAQIAWMRRVLESECEGQEPKFCQEYGWCPEVAFIATSDPAFPKEEIAYALSTKKKPLKRGSFKRDGDKVTFSEQSEGHWHLWEESRPKCWYYTGADAAAGYESGDFAAIVIWNGTTGRQAARFMGHIHPEQLADECDKSGRYFNNSLVNVELTGNLGRWAQHKLRDTYYYPNLYTWLGKFDKMRGKDTGKTKGWEMTSYSKGLMFDAFRERLRAGLKGLPGGIEVYDDELIRQMDLATFTEGFKWEITKGHDDVFVAAALAIVTIAQYPPPNVLNYKGNYLDIEEQKNDRLAAALKPQPAIETLLAQDWRRIIRPHQKGKRYRLPTVMA